MTNWNEKLQRALDELSVEQAKRTMEVATAVIRKKGNKFCVYSEKTGRNFGCYPTRKQAEKRLAQIEMFKHIKENK